ncbi:MAG: CarD family transcriptional regulator [Bacilli bacterium]
MFKEGDYIAYKNEICLVKQIKKDHLQNTDYYMLSPINDSSLKIELPTDNNLGYLRSLISIKEAEDLINSIPGVELDATSEKSIENIYKALYKSGKHNDLIKIIKIATARNKEREINGKKISERDITFLKKAEKALYNEISIVLNLSFEETQELIINKINED